MQPESGAVSPEPGQMQQLPGQAASSTSDSQAGVAVATPAVTPEVDSVRTAVLKDFASRLGAETKSGPNGARARPDITRCLNRDPSDPAGGAICSFPGLDLNGGDDMEEDGDDGADLLPGVGQSHTADSIVMPPPPTTPGTEGAIGVGGVVIPAMAATVFQSDTPTADAVTAVNTAPAGDMAAAASPEAAQAKAAKLEQAAARNLGCRTTWTRSSAAQAPPSMLRSLAESFSSLVDSRVRAWTLLLLRHSLSSGDDGSRGRLLALLATSSSIDLTKVILKFQCLDLPAEARTKLEDEKRAKAAGGTAVAPDERELVLPLILEADIVVVLQGQNVPVQLRSPGTIGADFGPKGLIKYCEVNLDTNSLVVSMVEMARLVVLKAVAKVTAIPSSVSTADLSSFGSALDLGARSSSTLTGAGGRSSGDLIRTSTGMPRRAGTKASASAQRLQDILGTKQAVGGGTPATSVSSQGRRGLGLGLGPSRGRASRDDVRSRPSYPTLDRMRKHRSVTWGQGLEFPRTDRHNLPDPKRRKLDPRPALGSTLKRTSRSFGKPNADSFDNVRNATFGEFGHAHKHQNVPTLVNGRLHVPSAHRQGPGSGMMDLDPASAGGGGGFAGPSALSGRGNATFDVSPAPPPLSHLSGRAAYSTQPPHLGGRRSSAEMMGLVRSSGGGGGGGGSGGGGLGGSGGGGLPRTATALEHMFLKNATGSGREGRPGLKRNP